MCCATSDLGGSAYRGVRWGDAGRGSVLDQAPRFAGWARRQGRSCSLRRTCGQLRAAASRRGGLRRLPRLGPRPPHPPAVGAAHGDGGQLRGPTRGPGPRVWARGHRQELPHAHALGHLAARRDSRGWRAQHAQRRRLLVRAARAGAAARAAARHGKLPRAARHIQRREGATGAAARGLGAPRHQDVARKRTRCCRKRCRPERWRRAGWRIPRCIGHHLRSGCRRPRHYGGLVQGVVGRGAAAGRHRAHHPPIAKVPLLGRGHEQHEPGGVGAVVQHAAGGVGPEERGGHHQPRCARHAAAALGALRDRPQDALLGGDARGGGRRRCSRDAQPGGDARG
mmetsp:Transcript_54452/g.152949  ORF Transcript_54452/g.152949 Transcript_54452/m.152949 type:complete len:339 (-) Transcript_54452:249-1265(-)